MRSLSPSKAFVTDVLPLAGLTADADTAPAPFACAAGFGPPGDWALISARGTCGFSIAGDGATGLNPATPVAEAASRGAWLALPNVAPAAAGLSVAGRGGTAGTAARQVSAPAAARIMMRFTGPNPPLTRFLTRVM